MRLGDEQSDQASNLAAAVNMKVFERRPTRHIDVAAREQAEADDLVRLVDEEITVD